MADKTVAWSYVGLMAFVIASMFTIAVLWLFYGWKVYKFFTAALTACAAVIASYFFVAPHLPTEIGWTVVIALGVAGALVSFVIERVLTFAAMGLLGAAVTGLVAILAFNVVPDPRSRELWAIIAAGFLIAGIPAAIFHRAIVVFVTSGYGALVAILATVEMLFACMLGKTILTREDIMSTASPWMVRDTLIAIGLAWVAMTTIGVVYQHRLMAADPATKKAKAQAA